MWGRPAPSAAACARAGVGSRDLGVADGGGKSWADVGESWADAADGLDMAGTGPRRIVALSGIAMYLRARADQRDEPSPGADVAGGEPSPGADVAGGEPSPVPCDPAETWPTLSICGPISHTSERGLSQPAAHIGTGTWSHPHRD